jgi:uncharacterized protein YciI
MTMQFLLVAYDGTDEQALQRRMAVREAHLTNAQKMFEAGELWYAAGILNEAGKMIGSMMLCDFPSRQDMEKQWLINEPYIVGKVWEKIEIARAQVAPFCPRPPVSKIKE